MAATPRIAEHRAHMGAACDRSITCNASSISGSSHERVGVVGCSDAEPQPGRIATCSSSVVPIAGSESASPALPDSSSSTHVALFRAALACGGSDAGAGLGLGALMAIGVLALSAEPALASQLTSGSGPQEQFMLAENQEFWGNVLRYGRYFVTVMLGTGYVIARPVVAMFKNPVSGLLALLLIVGSVVGTKVTIDAMLGLSNVPETPYVW